MILVSACLAGINCKHDGSNNYNEFVCTLVKQGQAIPVCPEQLGGLPTPRATSEILDKRVKTACGKDLTTNFLKGARETLFLARMIGCKKAIFKQRSPSCGFGEIYDGSHTGTVIEGNGITADFLYKNGIEILNESQIDKFNAEDLVYRSADRDSEDNFPKK